MKFKKLMLIFTIFAVLFCMTAVSAADDAAYDIASEMENNFSISAEIDEQQAGADEANCEPASQENESEDDSENMMAESQDDGLSEDGGYYIDASDAYYYLNKFRNETGAWYWTSDDISKVYFNTLDTNQLQPLMRNEALEETAKIRAKEVSELFSHTRPDGSDCFTAFPDYPLAGGECIARYYATCEAVTEGWKEINEPFEGQGHRRMMLDPDVNCVGIAGYVTEYGAIFWVQDYGIDYNYSTSDVEYFISPINLDVPDVVKSYYDPNKKLEITLTDSCQPISNAELKVSIEENDFTVTTDGQGKAYVDIDLDIGVHKAVTTYGNIAATTKITIIPLNLQAPEATGVYGDTHLVITLTNNSIPLSGEYIYVCVYDVATYFMLTNSEGIVNHDFNDLEVGEYDVLVNFDDVYVNTKIIVNKIPTEIIPSWQSLTYNSVSLNALIAPSVSNGTLTFDVNGKKYNANIKDSEASIELSNLAVGNYTVNVTYAGDAHHEASNATIGFEIEEVRIYADDLTKSYGESKNFTASLTKGGKPFADAEVVINIDGKKYVKTTDSNGMVSLPVDLNSGSYDAVASFDNIAAAAKINISKTATTTDLSYSQNSYKSITLTASISPSVKSGNVTFEVNGEKYEGIIKDSKASLRLTDYEAGNYTAIAFYEGDENHEASASSNITFTIEEYYIVLSADNLTKNYRGNEAFTVSVRDNKDNPVVGETVNIKINGKTYPRITNGKGIASLNLDLAPKTYMAEASYGDTSIIRKVVVKNIITAKNVKAKKSAKTLKIKVSLKKVNGKILKNKKVTLKFNKKTYKLNTNKKGIVTFTIKKNVYKKLKTGKKYTYQVTYGKDTVKKTIKFKK